MKRLGEPFLRYSSTVPEGEIDVFVKPLNPKEAMEAAAVGARAPDR